MSSFKSDRIAEIHRELHSQLPSEPALRVKALEGLLVEKGMIDSATIDAWIEHYTEELWPMRGAQVVALFRAEHGLPPRRLEMDHLAFTVKGGYEDPLARLGALGIEVETRADDRRCIYLIDPDGHRIQILAAGG